YRMLRLLAGRPASAIAASTFALHAIHSEVVAGIVGRAELLAFCFGAGALLGGEQARRRAGAARALLFGGSAVSLFLAFCSKESAVAWAPFLLVFGMARAWSRQPPGERAAAVPLLGKVAPGVLLLSALPLLAFFVLRHGALGQLEHEVLYFANPLYHAPPATRLLSAGMIWGHGLWLTLFPFRLASDYGIAVFPMIESILDARFLVPALVLSGILIAGLVLARRSPLSFLALTCCVGFSFLTSNVPFAIGTPFGERLYYTPSLGLAFLAAAFVPWLRARPRVKQAALALLCLWLAACFVRTFDRCLVWKNNRSVFTTDVRIQPRSARLQRGAAWFAEGERKREHLERAVSLYPGYAEAWSDLAGTYVREQNLKKAEDCLRSALSSLKGPGVVVDGYDIHWNLGFLLARTKRDKEAGEHLATALRLRPAQFREQLDRLGDAARRKALELLRGIRER
ncbi:MAG: protein O-mannosyl-transferase TMTC1-related protein, partial [Planctomycetota bacterium]